MTIRFQTRLILVFVAIYTTILEGILYCSFRLVGSIGDAQIDHASNAIIQLDSFILAGFIVGFFYFWQRHESLWERLLEEKKISQPEPKVTLRSIPAVIGFVLSGLFAVEAILVVSLILVEWSLAFFVFGVCVGFGFWLDLQSMLAQMERALRNK